MGEQKARRNSRVMIVAVVVRLTATTLAALVGALALQALVGTPASMTVLLLLAAAAAIRVIAVVARWRSTTYLLGDAGIQLREGRVSTTAQHVPYGSVHAFEIDEPWFLRALGRVALHLRHGSSDSGSVSFDALARVDADRIVARILEARDREGAPLAVVDGEPLGDPSSSLLRHAIARAHPWLIAPLGVAALGLLAQARSTDYAGALELVRAACLGLSTTAQVAVAVGTILVASVASVVVRLIATAGFRAERLGRDLVTVRGLLSTRTRSLAVVDVTLAEVRRLPIQRLLGRAMVLVSGGAGRGDRPVEVALDVPWARGTELAEQLCVGSRPTGPTVARSRASAFAARASIGGLLMAALAAWSWSEGLPVVAASLILVAILAFAVLATGQASLRFEAGGGRLDMARGWITRRHWILDARSVLHLEVVHGLATAWLPNSTLHLVIADRGARRFSVRSLPAAEADAAAASLRAHPSFGTYAYAHPR
jgi:uncharacterized membrane protein YdbT with pleckstrin-like domain